MSTNRAIAMLAFWLAFLGISFVSSLALNLVDAPTLAVLQPVWNSTDLPAPSFLTNSTNTSTLFADRAIRWECGPVFGVGDYERSCFDAVRQMAFVPGSATRQFTWGDRVFGDRRLYDVNLPQSVWSCKSSQSIASSLE